MAIQYTFDPEDLLAPISEEAPCGTDPRTNASATSPFLAMKDARANARRKERALDVDPDAAVADEDWGQVARTGYDILAQESKDLEVAAWLIEALVRVDGFSGLCTGLVVARELVRRYWDSVFPLPDEDGNEPRLAPFIALNGATNDGTLIQPLRKVPLTNGNEHYALWKYEQSVDVGQISDEEKRAARISSGALKPEDFELAVQSTPASFFKALVEQIQESLSALSEVSDAFGEHVGVDAPPAGAIRNLLNTVLDAVKLFAADKLAQAETGAEDDLVSTQDEDELSSDGAADETPGSDGAPIPAGKPRTRKQALQQLLQIAAFFRETEPHSPLSYTLEEAVRRSRMPLAQLLEELIVDPEARRYFYLAAGLRVPEQNHDAES